MAGQLNQGVLGSHDASIDHYLGTQARGGMPQSALVNTGSGNPLIDGLLTGVKWNINTLTISAPTVAAAYGLNYGNGEAESFTPITQAQGSAVLWAARLISDYANINFNIDQTGAQQGSAEIRVANFDGRSHAFFPDGNNVMGDIWMGNTNNSSAGPMTNPIQGGFNFATMLHEFGHAMGLKHGQDNGIGQNPTQGDGTPIHNYPPLPAAFDNWNWSLMTYRSYTGASTNPVQGQLFSDNPITYMPADILALQYMYGARYNGSSSGNNTYHWDNQGFFSINGQLPGELGNQPANNGRMLMTVWDGGGVDTYDFSFFSTNQRISLVPGAFSTFNTAQIADLDRNHAGVQAALGNVANAFLFNNDVRSLIENAVAGSGNDIMVGNQGNNTLTGNGGNDDLTGGLGADALDGGPGNDIYRLGNKAVGLTQIIDASGVDTVFSSITRSLVPFTSVDRLTLEGNGNINGTGNALNNIITGTNGNNVLDGGVGADTLIGKLGNDTYVLGNGTDVVTDTGGVDLITSTITRNLASYATVENLTLLGSAVISGVGNGLNNIINGNAGNNALYGQGGVDTLNAGGGNDVLDGGPGADHLNGGANNDIYQLGAESDSVVDTSGLDTVTTTITRSLAAYATIEGLTLLGGAAINGTGNALANTIIGNNAANLLHGGDGNDLLRGGIGTDSYYGDAGNDRFRFVATNETVVGPNRDVIFDFDDPGKGDDLIDLTAMPGVSSFIGTAAFTAAGQVRVQQAGTSVLVQINTAGVGGAESEILIVGATLGNAVNQVWANDFLL